MSCWTACGRSEAKAGTRGSLDPPVAATTASQRQVSPVVRTSKPSPVRHAASTSIPVCSGGSKERRYASNAATVSAAVMYPSGSSPS